MTILPPSPFLNSAGVAGTAPADEAVVAATPVPAAAADRFALDERAFLAAIEPIRAAIERH